MKALLTDPVVLITSAIILVGLVALFWAIGKFRRLSSATMDLPPDDLLPPSSDLPSLDFGIPPLNPRMSMATPPPSSAAPAVSKDVADRLESMTQRLAEKIG